MNTYITDLLNSNSRLIIPDFGAFIVKQKNPKIVVFNEFLKYNDGLLIDYVAGKENIDKDAAREKVISFVVKMREDIDSGEGVLFEGMGRLVRDHSGKIILAGENEMGSKKETKEPKKEKAPKTLVSEPAFEIVNEDQKKEIEPKPESKKVEPVKSEKKEVKTPVQEKTVKENKPDIPSEAKKELKEPVMVTSENKPVEKKETVAVKKPEVNRPAAPVTFHEPVKAKNNNTSVVLWIILILVVNGLILGWFVFNDRISDIFNKDRQNVPAVTVNEDQTEEVTEPADEDEVIPENIPAISEEETPQNVQPGALTGEKKYYIVAGCFRELDNANSLVKELKAKGYHSEKFGKIGSLHAVSYASFSDKTAANAKLKEIRANEKNEAWIIYY